MDKIMIDPEKEYEALRQEILKRTEYQYQILGFLLTIVAAFLGIGIQNALVVMLLPPIVLLVTIISKVNTYAMFKIASFMARKFSTGHPTWELFNYKFVGRMNPRRFLWGIGTFGIFVLPAMIATVIGFLQLKGDVISKILFIIDLLSLISIVLIFLFYHSRRMRNSFSWDESF